MRTRSLAAILVLPFVVSSVSGADAGRQRVQPKPAKVARSVDAWFSSSSYRAFRSRRSLERASQSRVPLTVRLRERADLRRLVRLEGADLTIERSRGRALAVGRVVCVSATRAGVERLRKLTFVERVELDSMPFGSPALDLTADEVEAVPTWTAQGSSLPITGDGIVVGLLDLGIDVHHPQLFRADGGYFDWLDVDGNGRFEPDVDAVDLDRNGSASGTETVRFVDAVAYNLVVGADPILGTDNSSFELGWDHLYADENANGARDFGIDAGFGENDPGYGEPLLVPDDVNRNGVLDIGERLVVLGTPKIRAFGTTNGEFTRGEDLITAPGHSDDLSTHGTNAAGIIAGGQRGFSNLVGIAPDAELVVGALSGTASYGQMLAWALAQESDVVVGEFLDYIWIHLDGSTNLDVMIDAAAADGVPFIVPAGNLGEKEHYAKVSLSGGTQSIVAFSLPDDAPRQWIALSAHWRAPEQALDMSLRFPDGTLVPLDAAGEATHAGSSVVWLRDDSPRGTARFDVGVNTPSGVPVGQWELVVQQADAAADPVDVHLYNWDDISFMARGVRFLEASEDHLVVFPATADSAIAVTSYAGRDGSGFDYPGSVAAGVFRGYSSRGFRIDGAQVIDVAAPDNPLTATNARTNGEGGAERLPYGAYDAFRGTSGAAPHVGGVAALVAQQFPDDDGLQIAERIPQGARTDDSVTGIGPHSVAELWGSGKLSAHRAVFGEPPAVNTPPIVTPRALSAVAGVETSLTLSFAVQDAESAPGELQIRADLDYDGVWDVGPVSAVNRIPVTFTAPGLRYVKLEVADPNGATATALVQVEVAEETGCGCKVAGSGRSASTLVWWFAAIAMMLFRRRRC